MITAQRLIFLYLNTTKSHLGTLMQIYWVESLYRHLCIDMTGFLTVGLKFTLPTPKGTGLSYAMSETFQGTHFGSSGLISSLMLILNFSTYNEKSGFP